MMRIDKEIDHQWTREVDDENRQKKSTTSKQEKLIRS